MNAVCRGMLDYAFGGAPTAGDLGPEESVSFWSHAIGKSRIGLVKEAGCGVSINRRSGGV